MTLMLRWGSEKRTRSLAIVGLVILIACSAATVASAAERGIILDVRDARLADIVVMLTQQSGASICLNPEVADKRVTAVMYDKPLEMVLEHVVKHTAGVEFYKTEDGTYVIGGPKPALEPTPVQHDPMPTPVQTEYESPKIRTEIIKLVHSHPSELLISMGILPPSENPNTTFLGLKYGGVIGVLDEDKYRFDNHLPADSRIYMNSGEIQMDTVPPAIDSGSSAITGEAGRSASEYYGSAQYAGAGTGRPGGGYSSGYGGGTPGLPGGGRPGGGTSNTGTGTSGDDTLMPEGVRTVIPYPLDNSIIVRGTEDGISEFKELVYLLDVPPKQVQIKAEFIEVSTNDIKRLGIDWSLERLNETITTDFNPQGLVLVGVRTGNLAASLRAELTKNSGNIINSPIISTINNEAAEIQVGSNIPFWTSVVQNLGNGQLLTTNVVNWMNIVTYLRVLPRVNGDGTITLTLMPSVQDTGRFVAAPGGDQSEVPESRYQSLYTRRRVMNGETIVVGGFIRKDQSINETEVPILGRLPIIGPLFRSQSVQSQDRELLIFVTPTIIGEKSAGTAIGVSPSL